MYISLNDTFFFGLYCYLFAEEPIEILLRGAILRYLLITFGRVAVGYFDCFDPFFYG